MPDIAKQCSMRERLAEEAEKTKDDERNMKILQQVGNNGIRPSIQVTDYPTNYE